MHYRHGVKDAACLKALKHWHHFTPGKRGLRFMCLGSGMCISHLGQCPGRFDVQMFGFVIFGGSNSSCIGKITQETWFGIWIKNNYSEILFCITR